MFSNTPVSSRISAKKLMLAINAEKDIEIGFFFFFFLN
jgi:5,10-methylene-tetrahydrofolate dehydrogenase/methenyl tetrahydrofolate cyclohydrolase